MKKVTILYILLIACSAQSQTVKKYSNAFMDIGVGASAMGLSNSVVATTNDVYSGYWNPAGLIHVEGKQVSLMHAAYFANIAQYDYAAFAMPIDERSALGISVIRLGVDDILNTTQLIDSQGNVNYDKISLFSTADYGFTLSYARSMPLDGFTYGVNAKVIRRIIGKFANSWGFGFDLGFQWKGRSDWQVGIMLRDITTTYNVWNINQAEYKAVQDAVAGQNQSLPETTEITLPKAQLGVGKKYTFHYDYTLMGAAQLNMEFAQTNAIFSTQTISISPAVGFEFGYLDMVFARAGVGNFQTISGFDTKDLSFQPNIGLGFKYKGIQVDYALTDLGDQSVALYSNIFSLKIDFESFR